MDTYLTIKKLISIYSPSGKEDLILEWINNYLSKLNIKIFLHEWGLAAWIKGDESTKAMIFNAHVDTVAIGNEDLWEYPALNGLLKKGKIYGVGASDMKAAIASILLMSKDLTISKPKCDVWLTFVKNEEVDGSGTKGFVKWFEKMYLKKYKKIAALIGEPTDLSKIEIGHKGNIFLKVTTFGKSGHGSKPFDLNEHSVFKMLKVSEAINKWSKKVGKEYKDGILGIPTVGIMTAIEAGKLNVPNKFPDSCIATFDIRTTPQSHKKITKEFVKIVKKIDPKTKIEFVYDPVSYGYTNMNNDFVKIVKKVTNVDLGVSKGSSDMCFFTEVGIPTVIFGPGDPACIHSPNECCKLENIDKCKEIYIKIIDQFSLKNNQNKWKE
ncbi:MAG TPA: M20 family metallopeptidase [Patescibacteria group bacterium]|nr:M20 family metallopeptidase [Patescibacteria group bacterium]